MDAEKNTSNSTLSFIKNIYEKEYKKLLIFSFLLLFLAIGQIAFQIITTGDFVEKGISLKGGMSMIVPTDKNVDKYALEAAISEKMPEIDVTVRTLTQGGKVTGFIIESDLDISDTQKIDDIVNNVMISTGLDLKKNDYSIEGMGSSLGASFFKEAFRSLYIAFMFMGLIVFLYFGKGMKNKIISGTLSLTAAVFILVGKSMVSDVIGYIIGLILIIIYFKNSIPSIAVILAAFSDIVITLAVINIIGMKLSTAGVAAFLMLIGYSVDTDILLSTKVLKRKHGSLMERIYMGMKTGLTMNFSTLAAVIIAMFISDSEVIKQIMTIISIGLLVDLISTWIQNAGLLRMFIDKRKKHEIRT